MDTVSNKLVRKTEHLAAKEQDIYLRSWKGPKIELKHSELDLPGGQKLQLNANVAPYLLEV